MAACAPSHGAAFSRAFAEAERAETAGRFEEAARKYDEAASGAKRDRDRDHARYLAALMVLRSGDTRDGVARLEKLARDAPDSEDAAAAAYRAAAARIDSGDGERGWPEMEQVMQRFPKHGIAHSALRRLLAHIDETNGKAGTLEYLRALASGPLGKSELGELIAFQIAERLAAVGRLQEARDAFVGVADRWPYPFGALWDDALWRASELDEKLGRFAIAVDDLERMLKERETTTLMGSYQRPRMSPALLRVGTIYADDLHDHAKARAAFHRLYSEFTTSPLRPQALWREARLFLDDGDTSSACSRLATLVHDFPDGRYVPCATGLCPSVKRPEKSKAPTTCHPYLMRDEKNAAAADERDDSP